MNENELIEQINNLNNKLNRALRQVAGYREKSKALEMQYDDARTREKNSSELVMELIERQKELNVMLNRANIMLSRTQETMALTSIEFNEMAKALPAPEQKQWANRINKINDLFKKTGIQDADMLSLDTSSSKTKNAFSDDNFSKPAEISIEKDTVWSGSKTDKLQTVEAVLVDEDLHHAEEDILNVEMMEETNTNPTSFDEKPSHCSNETEEIIATKTSAESSFIFPPKSKSWWQSAR